MRVASNSFPDNLLSRLNDLSARQARLQDQASTGQRIQSAEEDPAAARRVLDLQAEAKTVAQFQNNVGRLQTQAGANYSAMSSLKKISDRANEVTTLAGGVNSPQDLAIYGKEIGELLKQAVQLGNSQVNGSYLFGGTVADQPPYSLETDAEGTVTGVTYQGNAALAENEISQGVTLSVQVAGANTTGSGPRGLITDDRAGADFFNHLISLQNNLLSGDTAAIASTDRPALANDEENIIYHLSENGALQGRLEATAQILNNRAGDLQGSVSKEADADLAQTMVELTQAHTAYQAALQSGSMILQTSLLNYLK